MTPDWFSRSLRNRKLHVVLDEPRSAILNVQHSTGLVDARFRGSMQDQGSAWPACRLSLQGNQRPTCFLQLPEFHRPLALPACAFPAILAEAHSPDLNHRGVGAEQLFVRGPSRAHARSGHHLSPTTVPTRSCLAVHGRVVPCLDAKPQASSKPVTC